MEALQRFAFAVRDMDASQRLVPTEEEAGFDRGADDLGIKSRQIAQKGETSQFQANNLARQKLLSAVLGACKKTSFGDLPASVKKAFKVGTLKDDLKLNANGEVTSGRPLTARRVRRVVAAVEKYLDFNPTGKKATAEESGIAKEMIADMQDVANKKEDESYGQMAKDYGRYWTYAFGEKSFTRGLESGDEASNTVKDPNSEFRKAFSEVFTDGNGKIDTNAQALATNLLHQGLMSVLSLAKTPLKLPFFPTQKGGNNLNDAHKYTNTVHLSKSKQPGWYDVNFKTEQSGVQELEYIIPGKDHMKIPLKIDPKNTYTLSYSFKFHVDQDRHATFEMIQNPTHTLNIPRKQDLSYTE